MSGRRAHPSRCKQQQLQWMGMPVVWQPPVLAGTVQPAPDRAEGHGPDIQLDVEPGLDDLFSPGTPVDSPTVKQEFSWPDASWSEAGD